MKATPYDIFRKDLLGTPVWMEAVDNIETAKLRMMELAGRSPGEYFVFCQESQEIVSNTAPRLYSYLLPYLFFRPRSEVAHGLGHRSRSSVIHFSKISWSFDSVLVKTIPTPPFDVA